ncbi:MAG: carboxypeptidase-like regulatory domain-containing protein [Saonia sp.]
MYKNLILCGFLVLAFNSLIAQDFSGRILDLNTRNPIPYATVQIDETKGVISNEEGFFTINLENQEITYLTVSCLGYTKVMVPIGSITENNGIITLQEAALQLDEVFVSNKTPNADAILRKVRARLQENYRAAPVKHELFYRETSQIDFNTLDLEVEKASHVEKTQLYNANTSLDALADDIMASKAIQFVDFKGNLWVEDRENAKLSVEKATKLIDSKKDFSIENVQKRAQHIILKYLDTTKTYKLKTGLFKIEDSLSLNDAKSEKSKNEYAISELKSATHGILKGSQFYDGSFLNKILNPDFYMYSFQDAVYFNDELIYVIQFYPKRAKAKFTGKLYVSDGNYAIIKTDYAFAKGKRGEKVNLKLILGVKYIENAKKGTIIYQKNENGTYSPYYIKQEEGSYFYVNRPVKFIENSKEKNKVAFEFKIEGSARNKEELLFINSSEMISGAYKTFEEKENVTYRLLQKYDPTIWQNSKVIAPLNEMKNFGALEN